MILSASMILSEAKWIFQELLGPEGGTICSTRVLVRTLTDWLEQIKISSPDDLIFRTRNGTRPSASNWRRAWHRALESIGQRPLRIYDCRHAAATTWLQAGISLGETAKRMGHSVETLVATYVGALDESQDIANQRIEAALT